MEAQGTLSKLKEKERETRRKIIIDAARKIFSKKTYDTVSMKEIAKAAGISKSSIYTYFKSQEELYIEVVCKDADRFVNGLAKELKKRKNNQINTLISYYLDYNISNKRQWQMFTHFALHGGTDPDQFERMNDLGRKVMDQYEAVFNASGYKGDSRLLAHTLFSSLSGILIAFRNYPGKTEAKRISHMKRLAENVEEMITALISKTQD